MISDYLEVQSDNSPVSDYLIFKDENMMSNGFSLMGEIRRQGKLCDVTLKVGDECFTAHRIVLAATIPYFHAMFTHDLLESKQKEITIQGIDASALESLINYAYSGKVVISTANVENLLVSSSFLHLTEVRMACCEFLSKRLSPQCVIGVRSFAESLGCFQLVESANKYLQRYFQEVCVTEEFLELSASEIMEIVGRDELHVLGEEQVFEAVIRWVKKDEELRTEHLPSLLTKVRMPLLSAQYLIDHVSTEEVIKQSHKCRDLVDEAKDCHLLPERFHVIHNFSRPRQCHDVMGMIYAIGGLTRNGDSLSTVEVFNPIVGKWQMAEAMSMLRSRVGVGVIGTRLYAIGGYNGSERLSTVEVFELASKTWSKVAPMNCKRSAVGAANRDGCLYVCGGYDGVSSLKSVECFNPENNEWRLMPSMSRCRSAAGIVALGKYVYAIGGHDGLSIFNSVERYSSLGGWENVPAMTTKRCRLGAASLNGKLYVCGGYDGASFLKTVEMFDPETNSWTPVASMNMTRSRVALIVNMGKLWAIGGYDGITNLSSTEIYDPTTDTWTMGAPMCAHEGGVGVGVIPLLSQSIGSNCTN